MCSDFPALASDTVGSMAQCLKEDYARILILNMCRHISLVGPVEYRHQKPVLYNISQKVSQKWYQMLDHVHWF